MLPTSPWLAGFSWCGCDERPAPEDLRFKRALAAPKTVTHSDHWLRAARCRRWWRFNRLSAASSCWSSRTSVSIPRDLAVLFSQLLVRQIREDAEALERSRCDDASTGMLCDPSVAAEQRLGDLVAAGLIVLLDVENEHDHVEMTQKIRQRLGRLDGDREERRESPFGHAPDKRIRGVDDPFASMFELS